MKPLAATAAGLSRPMVWNAVVDHVHDGDTIVVVIDRGKVGRKRAKQRDVGFHDYIDLAGRLRSLRPIRLYGCNADEIGTPGGDAARDALAAWLPPAAAVTLTTWLNRNDKYNGRVLAEVMWEGVDVASWMVAHGLSAVWDGHGPKPTT